MNITATPAAGSSPGHIHFDLLDAIQTPLLLHRGGPILFANRALEALTGYSKADLTGMQYYNIAYPEFREQAKQRVEARLRGEEVKPTYEFRLLTADKHVERWVELTASVFSLDGEPTLVASIHDLTERRAAIAREKQLRGFMAQIIDGDPVPTFVLDAEHKVIQWNKACATITGIPAANIIGTKQQWSPFYASERPVMADLVLSGAMEAGIETHYKGKFHRSTVVPGAFEAEDFFPRVGDSGRWLYFTAAPIRDHTGRIVGAIETLQDVTARHDAEDALRRQQENLEALVQQRTQELAQANEQLVQSDKLASIGQLAAGVAHEINNPIGFVYSNMGALEDYIGDLVSVLDLYEAAEPEIASAERLSAIRARRDEVDLDFVKSDIPVLMQQSRDGITRVKKIVQDLKDFSHVDSTLEWQWANLHDGIDSTLNVVSNEVKYKADVVKEYGNLPNVECLPSQLNQVFMNLLVNAAHAMGETRGTITIRTGVDGDKVWLEFADNGSGIPPELQARIFDPFFTTKPVGKGTGLGLSLSYGIIQKHNGSITVHSAPGAGATFRIVLPVKHVENAGDEA